MIILAPILIAFSMFSAIPVPQVPWNARNMRFTLCAFPLVGAVIGLACVLWVRLCAWMNLPSLLPGAGLCLFPVMLSGGIHLDGYADTWDALASHGDVETRQKILKDPHMGAFAVIRLCMFFVAYFALWAVLPSFPAVAVASASPVPSLLWRLLLSLCAPEQALPGALRMRPTGKASASFPLSCLFCFVLLWHETAGSG